MDLPGTELFIEVLIAGILFAFGISPVLIYFSKASNEEAGLLPASIMQSDWKLWILVMIALIYSFGIAGNRLTEQLYKFAGKAARQTSAQLIQCVPPDNQYRRMELIVRDHSEVARDWVERHKTYIKILRAASGSSVLFLLSMGFYRGLRNVRRERLARYGWKHFSVTAFLCVFFFTALWTEAEHYHQELIGYCKVIGQVDKDKINKWVERPQAASETIRIVVTGDGRAEYPWKTDKRRYEDVEGINKKITAEIVRAVLDERAQMMLWTGDLANVNEKKPETLRSELIAWRSMMQPLYDHGVVVLPVRGNHEVRYYTENGPVDGEPIREGAQIWNEVFSGQYALPDNGPANEKNISFYCTRGSVLVVGLDQFQNHPHSVDQEWLDQTLKDNQRPFIFVFGHEPAFTAGYHTDNLGMNPGNRNLMWESLIKAGARVYFCGHDHFYDHMKIMRTSADSGPEMHQLTAGTAGAPFYDSNVQETYPEWKLSHVAHKKTYGYILITINRKKATIAFKERLSPGEYRTFDSFSYVAHVK
jgi:hypothetical protein